MSNCRYFALDVFCGAGKLIEERLPNMNSIELSGELEAPAEVVALVYVLPTTH